jgi:hypothetical protein
MPVDLCCITSITSLSQQAQLWLLCLAVQVLGPRFHVMLTSYETILKDKAELRGIPFEASYISLLRCQLLSSW